MFFSDRFTESLMALLYKYDIAPVRLKDEDMKKYLRYFIENGSYIDEIFDGQYDNMSNLAIWKTNFMDGCLPDEKIFTSRKASYLCTIYMLLFVIKTDLQEGDLYEIEKLQNMSLMASMINTFMSSLIMDFDFESFYKLDFNANYMPSPMLTEYIGGMYKTELLKQQYMEILGQTTLLESELIELNRKIDREILVTGISFMQIQAILLLMESSKLYPVYVSKIAKNILLIFKEMLANSRIKKIEIDSAISAGVIRHGIRKTTGMKIFFALENSDRYCLRIDFPHGGQQEHGIRPGTIPVALVAGCGMACEIASAEYKENAKKAIDIKKSVLQELDASGVEYSINGDPEYCVDTTINVSLKGVSSEALMISTKQFCGVSNGSACTSKSYSPSYVLVAMGLDNDTIECSLRISWGAGTNKDEAIKGIRGLLDVAKQFSL